MPATQRSAPLLGLREKRIFRGITQSDMGKVIGVTQSHYRQFEEGIIRLDVQRAKKLALALDNCTIDELL
jgi:transcriptional regulator with XRE-family HTH domain